VAIRLPAQWEKQKSIIVVFPTNQIDWQHSLEEIQKSYVVFIKTITDFQKCIIICHDKKILDNFFTSYKNIEVHEIQTNDTWIRDFGAIDFFENKKLNSYNFIFNAWGDKFSSTLDNKFNTKFYKNNLVNEDFILEGGSIDTNGNGVLLSTAKCLFNQNRNTTYKKEDILEKLRAYFGLKDIIMLQHGSLKGDDTDSHVDTLARFIDEESIVYIKCYDELDEHFEELNKMEKELEKTGFKLIALPLPKAKYFQNKRLPCTYINFIFVNGAIIVPIYNDENDKIALDILNLHVKNRIIKSVDASIFIREYGSLHCASINQFESIK